MRDKKMEQSIKVIALILLLGAFIFHSPIPISKQGDTNDSLPSNINNVAQQGTDSCFNNKFEKKLDCKFMFEKSDSSFNCLNTP